VKIKCREILGTRQRRQRILFEAEVGRRMEIMGGISLSDAITHLKLFAKRIRNLLE